MLCGSLLLFPLFGWSPYGFPRSKTPPGPWPVKRWASLLWLFSRSHIRWWVGLLISKLPFPCVLVVIKTWFNLHLAVVDWPYSIFLCQVQNCNSANIFISVEWDLSLDLVLRNLNNGGVVNLVESIAFCHIYN